jgi:hypothetical protein
MVSQMHTQPNNGTFIPLSSPKIYTLILKN